MYYVAGGLSSELPDATVALGCTFRTGVTVHPCLAGMLLCDLSSLKIYALLLQRRPLRFLEFCTPLNDWCNLAAFSDCAGLPTNAVDCSDDFLAVGTILGPSRHSGGVRVWRPSPPKGSPHG